MGNFAGGKFSMIVSFQSDPDAATLDEWRQSWQRASELLYSASDGAHQFGNIYFGLDSFGSRNADWWVDPVNAQAHVDGNRIWDEGHGTLGYDEKDYPFIIVHEFGHYGYDCGDEYQGDGCTAEVASCVMESERNQGDRFVAGAFVEGDVVEWCVEANHDPNGDTSQDNYTYGGESGHSCWYAINFHWGAPIPAEIPDGTRTVGADPVNVILLEKQTRIVLVLDRSYSMHGAAIEEALLGANSFIDLTNHDGETYQDHLAIVTFSTSTDVPLEMREMEDGDDRADASAAIAGVTASGSTAMGDGLRDAIQEIENYGDQAAAQAIVLLSDGYHNAGVEDPATMITELRDKGISVFTIAVGPDVDAGLLEDLAQETGGLFYRIPAGLSEEDAALQIRFVLSEIHDLLHDQGGIVTMVQDELEPGAPRIEDEMQPAFLEAVAAMATGSARTAAVAQRWTHFSKIIKAYVEDGASEATFFASYQRDMGLADLLLQSPSGKTYSVALDNLPDTGRRIFSRRPYLGVRVPKPEAGTWLALVASRSPMTFKYFAFVHRRGAALKVAADRRHYRVGARAILEGHLYAGEPLYGVDWEATLVGPDGSSQPLTFKLPKAPIDMGCDTQRYRAETPPLRMPGYYRVHVTARAGEDAVYAYDIRTGIEQGVEDKDPRPPVPAIVRIQTLTLGVGKETGGQVRSDPNGPTRIPPGGAGTVTVVWTGPKAPVDGAEMAGDPGVSIVDVHVKPGRIAIDVRAEEDAKPGPRDIVITIDGRRRVVEGAVVVAKHREPCDKRPGAAARGRTRSLCYDRDGNFCCAAFDTDCGCLKLWSYSEAMGERVRHAAAQRFVVRIRYDPDTLELLALAYLFE